MTEPQHDGETEPDPYLDAVADLEPDDGETDAVSGGVSDITFTKTTDVSSPKLT